MHLCILVNPKDQGAESESQDRGCSDNAEHQSTLGPDNNLTSNKPLSDSQSSLRSIADNDSSATMSADESSHQDPGTLPISTPTTTISRIDTPTIVSERPLSSSNLPPAPVTYNVPTMQTEQTLLKEPRPASEGVDLSHSRGFSPFLLTPQQSPHRPASAVSEPGRPVSSPRPQSAGPASMEKSYIGLHHDHEQQTVLRDSSGPGGSSSSSSLSGNCTQQDPKKQKPACVRDLIHSAIERNLSRGESNPESTISSK